MQNILIQLDTDEHPSVFDRVVAVDADIDRLFSYGGVSPDNVEPLVHGAMFTRGADTLRNTAIFVGGSNVAAGEALVKQVRQTFFGPVRVSVMMDSNGSNTTAAAAVLSAARHISLPGCSALVLGGTGPVGQRAAQLLAQEGADVRVASRSLDRAEKVCQAIRAVNSSAKLQPVAAGSADEVRAACAQVELIIAAGAAGVELLSSETRHELDELRVAIDLNAVPPAGIGGIEPFDKGAGHDNVICYGAIGVGGLKMKIHKAALKRLFTANDQMLDTAAIFQIGRELEAG